MLESVSDSAKSRTEMTTQLLCATEKRIGNQRSSAAAPAGEDEGVRAKRGRAQLANNSGQQGKGPSAFLQKSLLSWITTVQTHTSPDPKPTHVFSTHKFVVSE